MKQKQINVDYKLMFAMSFLLFVILAIIGFATRHYPMNGGLA